jgi:hypothetical protein
VSDEGSGSSRVTNRELDSKIEAVRQEQRAEHWKTRLVVAILSLPGALKAAPAVLGAIGFHWKW